jgi:hypothetical protein
MNRRWFKFEAHGAGKEIGFGTDEEAVAYAAILNAEGPGERCEMRPLNEAQSAGLVVLVTPGTFLLSEALAVSPDRNRVVDSVNSPSV